MRKSACYETARMRFAFCIQRVPAPALQKFKNIEMFRDTRGPSKLRVCKQQNRVSKPTHLQFYQVLFFFHVLKNMQHYKYLGNFFWNATSTNEGLVENLFHMTYLCFRLYIRWWNEPWLGGGHCNIGVIWLVMLGASNFTVIELIKAQEHALNYHAEVHENQIFCIVCCGIHIKYIL